jgi:putative ABC transport system substrate-binding protein
MKRREFMAALGGAAAWPLVARAQQPGGMPRIGLLSAFAENDPEPQAWNRELLERLQELGWANGRKVQIEFRFAGGDEARLSSLATELIEQRPDMIIAVPAAAPG